MKLQVMDESDDEDVDYKGHFCSEFPIIIIQQFLLLTQIFNVD